MPEMNLLDAAAFTPPVADLIRSAPLPGLDGQPNCADTAAGIQNLPPGACSAGRLAGLWLLAGDLERSHEISQSLPSALGSYWHGIMHRREGDFWNAKYWFRRAGHHPVLESLASHLRDQTQLLQPNEVPWERLLMADGWAENLTDLYEATQKQPSENRAHWSEPLQQIGWWEWQLLFNAS